MSRILIVDDRSSVRHRIRESLSRSDYEFSDANNGRDALEKMEQVGPHLVVTDLQMPHIDGLELISVSRRRYPHMPVVLITTCDNEEISREALHVGAASYVPLAALENRLAPTVERLLELAGENRSKRHLLKHLKKNNFAFQLGNDPTYVPHLISFMQTTLQDIGTCGAADITRVSVALDEALTNAIFHGNLELDSELRVGDEMQFYGLAKQRREESPYRDRQILVDAEISREVARFVITDEGPGFDGSKLPGTEESQNMDKLCGRGVMLMKMFMDEVIYNPQGNSVTLIKRRSTEQQSQQLSETG